MSKPAFTREKYPYEFNGKSRNMYLVKTHMYENKSMYLLTKKELKSFNCVMLFNKRTHL